MKQEEANIILHKMSVALDNVQMLRLQDSLDEIISESESQVRACAAEQCKDVAQEIFGVSLEQ